MPNFPLSPLANPEVPFVADVLMVNSLVENPVIPPETLAINQFVEALASKPWANPPTEGFVPERDQRLMLNGFA